jgi:hypothetical protein
LKPQSLADARHPEFDGGGHPGVAGDLAIEGDRISAIGRTVRGASRKIIDAVAP